MDRRIAFGLIALAAASMFAAYPVQAQSGIVSPVIVPITIDTDASEYDHASTIMVNGAVRTYKPGIDVTLRVISPQGNIVNVQQITVDQATNTYSTEISTHGNLWNYDGRYTIKVQYGVGNGASNRAHVDLVGSGIANPIRSEMPDEPEDAMMAAECGRGELTVGNSCVEYTMTGGTVIGASTMYAGDGGGTSMLIEIDAQEAGTLTVSPNRSACNDRDYIVLVDGEEWDDYNVLTNSVTVSLFAGASSVEIIGACVVPEFGTVAAMILVLAVTAVIVASARGRIGIMPKY